MSKGYLIFEIDMFDKETYVSRYGVQAMPIVKHYGGRVIVNKGRVESIEGGWNPPAMVVVEFDSYEQAQRFYYSEDYQKVAPLRHAAAHCRAIVVEGL